MPNDPAADRRLVGADQPPVDGSAPAVEGYTIERELGRGGEAIVYLAREVTGGRRVAIKVLRPDLAASVQTERFLQEIEIISDLVHPNILPLLHSGHSGGLPYYVSPYVDGESLRTCLQREVQLRIVDAVRIIREVAYALDYACRHGIVHRDIKPENILLADRHAVVADFGVARALTIAGDSRLTAKGLAVGTPAYMSPEQASAESRIDGRSDIYSLGCVLYELLAGSPPFHGVTPQQILAQHLAAAVPPLWHVRPTVSRAVEEVVLTALAKTPADRFSTAAEFGDALAAAVARGSGWRDSLHGFTKRVRAHRKAAMLIGAVMLLGAAVWRFGDPPEPVRQGGAVETDPLAGVREDAAFYRLAVLAVDGSDTSALRPTGRLMRDALKRWSDITVEDEHRVAEALGTWRAPLRLEDARRVAERSGAGRYVRVGSERIGDSLNISAGLYDTQSDLRVADGSVRVAATFANAEPAFAALADTLLFPAGRRTVRPDRSVGTRSVRARDAYLRGHRALVEWNLPLADSLFDAARLRDPQYAQALLWLAQVRTWRARPLPLWQSAAVQASAGRSRLDPSDTLASDALAALAAGKIEQGCELWRRSTEANRTDFASWYGYASCLRRDGAVVPDSTRPTKWRFRSSYAATLDAYQRAFHLLPSVGAFNDLGRILKINPTQIRSGRALPPDTTQFRAYPSIDGDSIVFVPFPADVFVGAHAGVRSDGVNAAIQRYRELYRNIALTWRSTAPRSSDALEAVATSLDLFGDPAALDTLKAARRLATQPDDRARLAVREVWGIVKTSLPADRRGLLRARALADSVLDSNPPSTAPEPVLLSGLASLVGRASLAAEYARAAPAGREGLPAAIHLDGAALLAFAALGGPVDTLAALERAISRRLSSGTSRETIASGTEWLLRAATIAFPDYRSESLRREQGSGDYLVAVQGAFLRGDTVEARRRLASIRERRRMIAPAELAFDALYPEAALVNLVEGPRAAAGWIDPTLGSLASVTAQVLADADGARAGPLMRTVALRAELADRLGDRATARRYADAVVVMWADADDFLKPTVDRMRILAR